MKLVLKDKRKGIVKIKVDDNEDYYYLDKLINEGDGVKTLSFRKIKKGEKQETVKKKYLITIKTEQIIFENDGLRLKGKTVETNSDDVPLNSYHSIIVEQGTKLTIFKEKISKTDDEIITKAVRVRKKILLSIIDYGESHFGLLLKNEIKPLGSFEENVKGQDTKKTEENRKKYLKEYVKKLEELDKTHNPGLIIIGSIGFVGESVKEVLQKKLAGKTRFCKVNNTTQTGLNEIINRGEVERSLQEEEVSKETQIINEFMAMVRKSSRKISYGFEQVREKSETGAVNKLLVSDELVRQEKIRKLLDKVEELGGKIEIISSHHEKGQEFLKFGGIAAFLRY